MTKIPPKKERFVVIYDCMFCATFCFCINYYEKKAHKMLKMKDVKTRKDKTNSGSDC